MANFTVCVELRQAGWTDYEKLHQAMEQMGFSRLITADGGGTYRLPFAEYTYSAEANSTQVLELACSAAGNTGKECAILVTEAISRAWSGLPAAKAASSPTS